MAVTLTQGNLPPDSTDATLDSQIKGSTQNEMVLLTHELWSNSGHSLDGVWYNYSPFRVTNTSFTQTPTNAVLSLANWAPLLYINLEDADGGCKFRVNVFVENCEVRVTVSDQDYGFLVTDTVAATNGDPQWLTADLVLTDVNISGYGNKWSVYIEVRRLTFDTEGFIHHIAGKILYRSAADIPGQ